ncbi:hypothetical protein E3P89_02734 [Wallemia ichthyophaga]|uniref:Uncharacterized protein n=1 Tax=Wallemia ichthyophaga TaxID=245174 RepID=A0A4T0H8Y0_WALIC|nr:hypothetical protein E3P90_02750 [Wallemia ichthyophaga]TIB10834.1 hypothetical protein E3P93_02758 [Wallemia ichthyophaga]TIB21219.1 hypothetical protein E3P89_02734 [Wallemia ichthyophaga]TIB22921.1 hypothetical protein E3P88_02769 [Wallemia ichthyophaga]
MSSPCEHTFKPNTHLTTKTAIDQIIGITGTDQQTAEQLLEATNGDAQSALDLFYADDFSAAAQPQPMAESRDTQRQHSGPTTLGGAPAEPLPSGWGQRKQRPESSKKGKKSSGIATLKDVNNDDDSDDEEDPGKREKLYAGGERSGLSVQGPSKGGPRGPNDIVGDIMKKAADSNEEASETLTKSNKEQPNAFSGRGNRLGSEEEPVDSNQGNSFETDDDWEEVDDEEPVNRSLTFWRDGFSIDDGSLMRYDEHQETLDALNSGRAPLSLLNIRFGQRVNLGVSQRTDEDYVAPPKVFKPFEGASGQRLGAPVTASIRQPERASASAPTSIGEKVKVDESKPTTRVQVRLNDGSRTVVRLNTDHTIDNLRQEIER